MNSFQSLVEQTNTTMHPDSYDTISHPQLVSALRKRPEDYQPTPQQMELAHFAMGLAGEAAEVMDNIKKHVWNGKKLDLKDVKNEMGDLKFYFQAICQVLGITEADCESANIAKLSIRYPGLCYSDADAVARRDMQEHTES